MHERCEKAQEVSRVISSGVLKGLGVKGGVKYGTCDQVQRIVLNLLPCRRMYPLQKIKGAHNVL